MSDPKDLVREAAEAVNLAIKILGDSYGKSRAEVEGSVRAACFDAKYALEAALSSTPAPRNDADVDGPFAEVVRIAQIMLDPENSPPQYGMNEGWRLFTDALSRARAVLAMRPTDAGRSRRTVWFMENNAGLWMGADMGSHVNDPNKAAQFTTREACAAACEADRCNSPHPGDAPIYHPTEHIFFGDAEVERARTDAGRVGAVAWWGIARNDGTFHGITENESEAMDRVRSLNASADLFVVGKQPYRVVALVPREEE